MEEHRVDFKSIEWESPLPGVRYKKHQNKNRQMRFVEYDKGFIEPNWCLKGHIGFVIAGDFEIDFNGEKVSYKKGDAIFIPAGESHKHKVKIISDKVNVFLVEET